MANLCFRLRPRGLGGGSSVCCFWVLCGFVMAVVAEVAVIGLMEGEKLMFRMSCRALWMSFMIVSGDGGRVLGCVWK